MENWKNNDLKDSKLFSLYISFDSTKKEKYLTQGYFDIYNEVLEKDSNSKKISSIISDKVGSKFIAKLENPSFPWNPFFFKFHFSFKGVKKYLAQSDSLKKKKGKFYGDIQINDLFTFLSVFLDYPQKLRYHDIEIYSTTSNFALNISSHGTLWMISDNKSILEDIFFELKKLDFLIIKGKNN